MAKDLFDHWESLLEQLKVQFQTLENENLQLKNENRALQERFDRMLFQQTLIALLQPGHSTKDLDILCRRLGICDPESSFVVLEFSNDAYLGRRDRVPSKPFSDPDLQPILTLVQTVFDDPVMQPVVGPQGDRILCILCIPPDRDTTELRDDITRRAAALNAQVSPCVLFTAVSSPVRGAQNLPSAYAAVRQVADYKAVMEDYTQDLLFAEDLALQEHAPGEETLVLPEQRRFVFLSRIGAFAQAREAAQALINARLLSNPAMGTLQVSMAALKDVLIHTLGAASVSLHIHDEYLRLNTVSRIVGAATVQELQAELDALLLALDKAFAKTNPEATLPQRMESYIDENYADPDLNVNAVAEFFSVTPAYATKVFRSLCPDGILNYIHHRRLFAAKELLGSGLSIGEIAGRTGYRTSANMIRAFKRAEGVTPGQLAAQSRQTGEEHTD
jgi:AraC-like DNA-binding protein